MNKKGMTLIELLVYMAIAALLLAPVIMLMQNSSVNMARDAVTTDMRISGRDILNIMYEDIRNTGFKLIDATGAVDTCVTFIKIDPNPSANPHVTEKDSSSFKPGDAVSNGAFDELTIRKGWLDPSNDNKYGRYDEVRYYVDNGTLKRDITNFVYIYTPSDPVAADPTAGNPLHYHTPPKTPTPTPTTHNIATNVEALQFQYSTDLNEWYDDPTLTSTPSKGDIKYIKISIITKDDKKLAPTNTSPDFFSWEDWPPNYDYIPPITPDQALRELHQIVVPIPNNGLFPQ